MTQHKSVAGQRINLVLSPDVRWATIAASVDDRTPEERGLDICEPTHKGQTSWMAGGGKRRYLVCPAEDGNMLTDT
jgi:hypothetical protein